MNSKNFKTKKVSNITTQKYFRKSDFILRDNKICFSRWWNDLG